MNKKIKITPVMQKVAVDILQDFEVLMMIHNGPYTFEEINEIVERNAKYYELHDDPFTKMLCTSDEYYENSLEYERQVAEEKYGYCDWLD